jgi:hypothetical protein
MTKNKIYIFGIIVLILLTVSSFSNVKANRIANNSDFDLNGAWGLTNYFDTIVANKQLAKYRMQTPTWFAILIKIDTDSLECFGSIERAKYPLNRTNDTLAALSSYVTGVDWYLVKKGIELQLIPATNEEDTDSTIYIFSKRDDLNSCFQGGFYGINVTPYFNDLLFKGKYINVETKQEVVFADNGKLIGIDGFNTYEVRDYFGTLHPHNNLDVITFSNFGNNYESKQYNWVFSENELILTEFVPEKIADENGIFYDNWDSFVLGWEKIKLKRVENDK